MINLFSCTYNKSSKFRISLVISFVILLNSVSSLNAQQTTKRTNWQVVNSNLTELLNDEWTIVGHSSHRAVTVTTGGIGAIDDLAYTFILSKKNKYIICYIVNPSTTNGAYSGCRSLN